MEPSGRRAVQSYNETDGRRRAVKAIRAGHALCAERAVLPDGGRAVSRKVSSHPERTAGCSGDVAAPARAGQDAHRKIAQRGVFSALRQRPFDCFGYRALVGRPISCCAGRRVGRGTLGRGWDRVHPGAGERAERAGHAVQPRGFAFHCLDRDVHQPAAGTRSGAGSAAPVWRAAPAA